RLTQSLMGHASPAETAGYAAWSSPKAAEIVGRLSGAHPVAQSPWTDEDVTPLATAAMGYKDPVEGAEMIVRARTIARQAGIEELVDAQGFEWPWNHEDCFWVWQAGYLTLDKLGLADELYPLDLGDEYELRLVDDDGLPYRGRLLGHQLTEHVYQTL